MSNTSTNKTANKPTKSSKDKDKLRVIVGEIGRDTKTGILGRGYSNDNGKTFHVTDTMYGRLYDPNDIDGIWNGGTADRVKKEVDSATAEIPAAVSAANSAVSAAESAVAASKVNSDAIVAQSEAISEAKSAMDSATAEIQQTAANAASDAAKIRADVARVQNEVDTAKTTNSASVEALKSDIDTAKQDLANVHDSLTKAQSAVEQNQKLINDSVAKISNDIAQDRKDLATAQQNNADLAKQLDDYSKQAEAQGKTIKSIQNDQNGFTATLADVKGNVSQVSDKVDGLSAGLKDAQDNVASIKAQADQLNANLTDHAKSIATLTASAKELSSTLEDADGRLSKVKQTATQNSSRLDVMDNAIKSKVTSTDVNNIVDGKDYATTSTVQSLITQTAGTINESITNLDAKYKAKDGVNLATKTGNVSLSGGYNSNKNIGYISLDAINDLCGKYMTISVDVEWSGWKSGSPNRIGYELQINYDDGSTDYDGCWLTPTTANGKQRVTATYKIKDQHVQSLDEGNAYIQINCTSAKVSHLKIERGTVATPWTPAPSDNATVTQVQSLTASIDGLQSTVKDKADKSQITQLSNLVQSKVSTSDFTSKVSQLSNDINARVTKGDLLSQINLEAGRTLIQSQKIYMDADTVAFSGKAFIPSAAITSLDADKITSGYIKVPMSDGNGNSVQVSNNGVDILSNNKESKLFNANRGIASVHIDAAGMGFGATTNGAYEQLGSLSVLLDNTDGSYEGMTNHNGIGYVVETQQQYGYPYGGDFFSLARSIKGPPSYYNGFLYEATGSGKHEIGSHFFDPIWIHPWGADNYMHATWVSWTAWDNNEKYPAIVQAGSNMGGICFPKSGEVTLFTASGKSFTPSQWKGAYTGYQHDGAGNAYHDPSQDA